MSNGSVAGADPSDKERGGAKKVKKTGSRRGGSIRRKEVVRGGGRNRKLGGRVDPKNRLIMDPQLGLRLTTSGSGKN